MDLLADYTNNNGFPLKRDPELRIAPMGGNAFQDDGVVLVSVKKSQNRNSLCVYSLSS